MQGDPNKNLRRLLAEDTDQVTHLRGIVRDQRFRRATHRAEKRIVNVVCCPFIVGYGIGSMVAVAIPATDNRRLMEQFNKQPQGVRAAGFCQWDDNRGKMVFVHVTAIETDNLAVMVPDL